MPENPRLAVIMDPISATHPEKDTTLALLLEAQTRGWDLYYLELRDLFLKYNAAWGIMRPLRVFDSLTKWFEWGPKEEGPLDQFDVVLMRKDPPVDMAYIYATYILEQVEQNGTLVVNKPQSLRDVNEKLFTSWFPQCMPPTLVTASIPKLKQFMKEQGVGVVKPLSEMAGQNVFKCEEDDPNLNVILENITHYGTRYVMAQAYIPEITEGDKRIILIEGEPIPYALARIPQNGDFRGNLAAGGKGQGIELSDRDFWICEQVGPLLKEKGLVLVGLDVIGDYLTEINVTSPTCVRELEREFEVDIRGKILDCIEEKMGF